MKIAIVIEQPVENGGGFQQSLNAALEAISDKNDDYIIFVKDENSANVLRQKSLNCRIMKFSRFETLQLTLRRNVFLNNVLRRFEKLNPFEKMLNENSVNLAYFVGPSTFALDCETINFIFTVWDLCHLDYPEFPEVRQFREIEKREFLYQNTLKKAVAVICDSETGKKNIQRIYNINPDRVFVNYFQPSAFLTSSSVKPEVLRSQKIEPGYLFYPAQFWPHKNHVYILDALKLNKDNNGKPIKVVFSGSDKGNAGHLKKIIKDYGISNDIYFVGFIPNEDLRTYYEFCKALVMPSYFGPTNIPPLESLTLNRPTLYSDMLVDELLIRTNHKELVHALDLNSPESLLKALRVIDTQPVAETRINQLIEYKSPLADILRRYRLLARLF